VISYITASNDSQVLADNLLGSLELEADDEVIVVEDPPSIAAAYNKGAADAKNRVRCFVHSDVQVLDSSRLRAELLEHCTPTVGMVGLIGSKARVVPWWSGVVCGSVIDGRKGVIDLGPGGRCAYLDGLLLATAQDVEWDESYPGFHLYDYDICQQMLTCGLGNVCLTGGDRLVSHNTRGPGNVQGLPAWEAGMARFREKWGML
jgi:hypothetical protein